MSDLTVKGLGIAHLMTDFCRLVISIHISFQTTRSHSDFTRTELQLWYNHDCFRLVWPWTERRQIKILQITFANLSAVMRLVFCSLSMNLKISCHGQIGLKISIYAVQYDPGWTTLSERGRHRRRNGQGEDRERDIKWHKRDITEGGMLPKGIQGRDGGRGGGADRNMKSDLPREPTVIRSLCN